VSRQPLILHIILHQQKEGTTVAVVVDAEKCSGCGTCTETCPFDALEIQEALAIVKEDDCSECGACVDECPSEALSLG
jgi:NAD-dependent dihydropyrimidine dehydrogenase PreA subunit